MISKLASLATEIKGHHFYNYQYTIDEHFRCEHDPNNAHSKNAIVVKSNDGSKIAFMTLHFGLLILHTFNLISNNIYYSNIFTKVKESMLNNFIELDIT